MLNLLRQAILEALTCKAKIRRDISIFRRDEASHGLKNSMHDEARLEEHETRRDSLLSRQVDHFFPQKVYFSRRKSAAKFLCIKTFSGKVVRHSLAYLSMHKWLVEDVGPTLLPQILGQIDPSA